MKKCFKCERSLPLTDFYKHAQMADGHLSLKVHGHHEDYSKPLEVLWLCAKHHKERHRELDALAAE